MIPELVFTRCVKAIKHGLLIRRESRMDKEYHFQNWFRARLEETERNFEIGGRNSFPDFRMVASSDGFELEGLAYPGRDASFDSNSQVPTGNHNARTIYYVFGRYPKNPDGDSYPVLDLVVCHGDFLNADHQYVHKNQSVKGFGSYGDLLIRNRKMYVVPTPFRLVEGVAHRQTLILPESLAPGEDLFEVGELSRRESARMIVGYTVDLQTNELAPETAPNPGAGIEHRFRAWRLKGSAADRVAMKVATPWQRDSKPDHESVEE